MNSIFKNDSNIYGDYKSKINKFIDDRLNEVQSNNFKNKINQTLSNNEKTNLIKSKKMIYLNTYIVPLLFLINAFVYTNYVNNVNRVIINNNIINNENFLNLFYSHHNPIVKEFNICIYRNFYPKNKKKNKLIINDKYGFSAALLSQIIQHLNTTSKLFEKLSEPYKIIQEIENIKLGCSSSPEEIVYQKLQKIISSKDQTKINDLKELLKKINKFGNKSQAGGTLENKEKSTNAKNKIMIKDLENTFYSILGIPRQNIKITQIRNFLNELFKNNKPLVQIMPILFSKQSGGEVIIQYNYFEEIKNQIDDVNELLSIYQKQLTIKNTSNNSKKKVIDAITENIGNLMQIIKVNAPNNIKNMNNLYKKYVIHSLSIVVTCLNSIFEKNKNSNSFKTLKDDKLFFDNDFRKWKLSMKDVSLSKKEVYETCIQDKEKRKLDLTSNRIKKQTEKNRLGIPTQRITQQFMERKKNDFKIKKDEFFNKYLPHVDDSTQTIGSIQDISQFYKKFYHNQTLDQIDYGKIRSKINLGNRYDIKEIKDFIIKYFDDTHRNKAISTLDDIISDKAKLEKEEKDFTLQKNRNKINNTISSTDIEIKNVDASLKELRAKQSKDVTTFSIDSLKNIFIEFLNNQIQVMRIFEKVKENREIDSKSNIFQYFYQKDPLLQNDTYTITEISDYIEKLTTTKNVNKTASIFYLCLQKQILPNLKHPESIAFFNEFEKENNKIVKSIQQNLKKIKSNKKKNLTTSAENTVVKDYNERIKKFKNSVTDTDPMKSNKSVIYIYAYTDFMKLYLMKMNYMNLLLNTSI